MNLLRFLFGKNLNDSVSLRPGYIYLDTENHELWYDDPSGASTQHNKIVDTNTLIYSVDGYVEFSGEEETSITTARLGTAKLGYMRLGAS